MCGGVCVGNVCVVCREGVCGGVSVRRECGGKGIVWR